MGTSILILIQVVFSHRNAVGNAMEKSDPAYWERHVTALRQACKQWKVDDDFKDFFARVAVSYLKPRWSAQETLEGHTNQVWCITHFNMGDTNMLASGSDDRTVRVWRANSTELFT